MNHSIKFVVSLPCFIIINFSGCVPPSESLAPVYVDPTRSVSGVSGLGFESQDIRAMTDIMIRDILSDPRFSDAPKPPRIIVDDTRFINESIQIFNINLLLDRLRIELMRSSRGRLEFVSRENIDLVREERMLEQFGETDTGNIPSAGKIAGADYRLIGKITSQTSASNRSGVRSNYFQFSFEILDLDRGLTVWGNLYELKKVGADDTIYR